jgi:hypothetical protein
MELAEYGTWCTEGGEGAPGGIVPDPCQMEGVGAKARFRSIGNSVYPDSYRILSGNFPASFQFYPRFFPATITQSEEDRPRRKLQKKPGLAFAPSPKEHRDSMGPATGSSNSSSVRVCVVSAAARAEGSPRTAALIHELLHSSNRCLNAYVQTLKA